jgi:hypothetical protein
MMSFMHGKRALGSEPLRPLARQVVDHPHGVAATLRLPQFASLASAELGSNVEVVKEGDKVVRLVVNCACGERIEIECLYSAGR